MARMDECRVAVLATDGVEQVELTEPVKALRAANAKVVVIAPKGGQIQGMNHDQPGDKLTVDHDLASVSAEAFDALVLPGGVANPDTLRTNPAAVAFVKHFVQAGKPIASICHGPWTLIEADGVRGKTHDVVAVAAHRPEECRRELGRPGSGGGRHAGDVAQPERPAGVLPRDAAAVRAPSGAQARGLIRWVGVARGCADPAVQAWPARLPG